MAVKKWKSAYIRLYRVHSTESTYKVIMKNFKIGNERDNIKCMVKFNILTMDKKNLSSIS